MPKNKTSSWPPLGPGGVIVSLLRRNHSQSRLPEYCAVSTLLLIALTRSERWNKKIILAIPTINIERILQGVTIVRMRLLYLAY
jgi:hypothetical protein